MKTQKGSIRAIRKEQKETAKALAKEQEKLQKALDKASAKKAKEEEKTKIKAEAKAERERLKAEKKAGGKLCLSTEKSPESLSSDTTLPAQPAKGMTGFPNQTTAPVETPLPERITLTEAQEYPSLTEEVKAILEPAHVQRPSNAVVDVEVLVLPPESAKLFVEAIAKPPEPNEALKKAFNCFEEKAEPITINIPMEG